MWTGSQCKAVRRALCGVALDIAMARRVLRDMKDASADDIRNEMEHYLKYARVAYIHTLETVLPSSDHVIDGTKKIGDIIDEAVKMILNC